MKSLGWSTGSFNSSSALMNSIFLYLLQVVVGDIQSAFATLQNTIIMARSGFGHGGMGSGAAGGHARSLIVVIVLVLLIPAIALVFTGPTTGSTGVYTNATVANNARTGVVQFSQFIGIAMILGVVGIIVVLI